MIIFKNKENIIRNSLYFTEVAKLPYNILKTQLQYNNPRTRPLFTQ